ncbi:Hypothetical predicted protein [Mytilus galloprovincialis]|uniref:Uncharacterized protein n=1 Tax=Mytilus galloprovincialis TaxID=29158 RepID=A0A8B6EHM6_MYTGA|nr:Hypothetical predicted protein [Mytilus galloprovincialis]
MSSNLRFMYKKKMWYETTPQETTISQHEKDKKELDVILKGAGFKQLIDTSSYKQTNGNLNGTKCVLTIPKSETPKRKKINESNGKTEDTTTEDTITKEEEKKSNNRMY